MNNRTVDNTATSCAKHGFPLIISHKDRQPVNLNYTFVLPILIPMVSLIGGYPIPYADAKAWALRHWPDIHIYDDLSLPIIISRYHKRRGGNFRCLGVNLEDGPGLVCFVVVYSKHDPLSTPLKYRQFPEGELATRCKELLFNHKDDEELAAKVQFMTVADPFQDYYKFRPLPKELKHAAANQETISRELSS